MADALKNFFDLACPCEFIGRNGERCISTLRAHDGVYLHQDADGKVIGIGAWESSFMASLMGVLIPQNRSSP